MIHTYHVKGMTCESCASKIKKALQVLPGIISVNIDIKTKKATVEMNPHVDLNTLNQALQKAGDYSLHENHFAPSQPESNLKKFIPLISILSLIVLFTVFKQWQRGNFEFMEAMSDFMGSFFVVFGTFKIINWKGFVESYRTYDLLAQKSMAYAYAYPLIELGLGTAYLCRYNLTLINWATLLVMGVSSIGVAKALLAKRKIVCACLGAVFKIPMTKVTLMEDVLMAFMAGIMLINL